MIELVVDPHQIFRNDIPEAGINPRLLIGASFFLIFMTIQ